MASLARRPSAADRDPARSARANPTGRSSRCSDPAGTAASRPPIQRPTCRKLPLQVPALDERLLDFPIPVRRGCRLPIIPRGCGSRCPAVPGALGSGGGPRSRVRFGAAGGLPRRRAGPFLDALHGLLLNTRGLMGSGSAPLPRRGHRGAGGPQQNQQRHYSGGMFHAHLQYTALYSTSRRTAG